MSDITNHFKRALAGQRRQIGLWQALANPYTAEICAGCGFDWLLFDGEHGPNTVPLLLAQLQAVAPYPTQSVVRLPIGDATLIKQYLDIGFQNLLVPFVESAEQAEALVRATRYPPTGVRGIGVGISRAARWNRVSGYLDRADDEVCLIVQIESAKGLENLDAIVAVDGVHAIFVGSADLSAALGFRDRADHPDMVATIESTIGRVVAAGKAAGTLALDLAVAGRWARVGCSFIAVGTDTSLLANGGADLAQSAAFLASSTIQVGY